MRLSVKIMAHKKRAQFIPELVERLGLTDDDVIWDRLNNRWDTGRRAWEAVDQTADFGCVIQDDARVAKDLIPALEKALMHVPRKCLMSPYIGTRRPVAARVERAVHEARAANASFIEMPSLNWGVGIIAPTFIINDMLPWCDKQTYPNYDRRIGRFAIDVMRFPTWCTFPSLVDHRETDSLVGHGAGRVAHNFIGEEVSALTVDWTKGSVRLAGGARRTSATYISARNRIDSGVPTRTTNGARSLRVARFNGSGYDQPPVRPEGHG